jgi:pyruvate carboxylase
MLVCYKRADHRAMPPALWQRDAHQSLLATRVRTTDILSACGEASVVLHDAFSFEW